MYYLLNLLVFTFIYMLPVRNLDVFVIYSAICLYQICTSNIVGKQNQDSEKVDNFAREQIMIKTLLLMSHIIK